MSKKKKKTGRPSEYKPEYCQLLINHMADGLSYESFAGVIRKSIQTLYNWEAIPEFLEAKKIAEPLCRLWWEKKGQELNETFKDADGMTVTRAMPPAVWIYNMKCRFRKEWHDPVELNANVKAEVTTEDKTAREVKELTSVLMELMKEEG